MSCANSFLGLYIVGFFLRLSYALARDPVLPLFALYFGAGPEAIGWVVGISTVTGIFCKLPAGALSDVIGRTKYRREYGRSRPQLRRSLRVAMC